jgi:hypothetical protein
MNKTSLGYALISWLVAALVSVACGSGSSPSGGADDPQTPPRGRANVERWLAQSFYQTWTCEPQPHPMSRFGAHGQNRVCSNDLLSSAGAGEFPVGAASVKEIYSGSVLSGYAVSLHNAAGTTGNTWYWYERVGSGVTDGQGAGVCVGCHQLAGSDSERSGHDFVYTQVRP